MRVGVVGAGWVGLHRHLPCYRRSPGVEGVVICDRMERHAQLIGRPGVVGVVDSIPALVDAGISVASVCSPPWLHADHASALMEAGIDVLLEKPMAPTLAEAEALVRLAEEKGRTLTVVHNFWFSRSATRLRQRMIGTPRYGLATQLSGRRRLPTWHAQLRGGLFLDESPHMLYMLQGLLGPMSVTHVRSAWSDRHVPDYVEAEFDAAGVPARLTMVFDTAVSEWHVVTATDKMVGDVDLFRDIAVVVPSDGRHRAHNILRTSVTAMWNHALGFARSGTGLATKRLYWGHDVLIERFLRASLGDGPNPVSTTDAIGVARLTETILQAMGR